MSDMASWNPADSGSGAEGSAIRCAIAVVMTSGQKSWAVWKEVLPVLRCHSDSWAVMW